jgi:AcrR family transcriptional regulator
MSHPSSPAHGLRADAQRNHERILDATRAVIREIGPHFGVGDVAAHAGVGLSTLYRRFAGRGDLVRAVFERYVTEEVEPSVAVAVAVADPWQGLVNGFEATIVTVVENTALLEAARDSAIVTHSAAAGFVRPLGPALVRAQEAGAVRRDVTPDDLPALITMVVTTVLQLPQPGTGRPANWRRYLAVVLDGIRAHASNPPLPPA